MDEAERQKLLERIEQLEEKIAQLRVSRRVLMQLVERIEREKNNLLYNLEREKQYLKKKNAKYAKMIMEKNRIINLLK